MEVFSVLSLFLFVKMHGRLPGGDSRQMSCHPQDTSSQQIHSDTFPSPVKIFDFLLVFANSWNGSAKFGA